MPFASVEHTFDRVECGARENPRVARTTGGMTELTRSSMVITVPDRVRPALEVSGGAE